MEINNMLNKYKRPLKSSATVDETTATKILERKERMSHQRSLDGERTLPYFNDADAIYLKESDTIVNLISEPYELPQYPIEERENKRYQELKMHQNDEAIQEDSIFNSADEGVSPFMRLDGSQDEVYDDMQATIGTRFQKIRITGEDASGVPLHDLQHASKCLIKALFIREKYMHIAQQTFPKITARFLQTLADEEDFDALADIPDHMKVNSDHPIHPPTPDGHPFQCDIPHSLDYHLTVEDGVVKVYRDQESLEQDHPIDWMIPNLDTFLYDQELMYNIIRDGPLKSFCYRRLSYLSAKFKLHILLNELKESAAQKEIPHRDFYNIRKVDTHVHGTSCMNQKHLLRFIKKKMRTSSDDIVLKNKDGSFQTLGQTFASLNLGPHDLSVDKLDVHADRNTFHRFDKFNSKYNPIGESKLREIFLKTDNYAGGKFFAELLNEVMSDLEESKYQNAEYRLSIYGKTINDWDELAKWACSQNVHSSNVRWLIQVPRLYDTYRANGLIDNFETMLTNIFMPLFEVTNDPGSHPELHAFLQYVTGFDSVDDESKAEHTFLYYDTPLPRDWTSEENPPYNYYLYYMYVNMVTLNCFRRERGFSIFNFRPHCGEAGNVTHLVSGFMLAESINHGLLLRKVPVLQYLYYLAQVGVAMSPLSNNSLFLEYSRNPLPEYFARGLNISLSTDDPLQFHFTKEPLMEEYSIAAQVYKLSTCDMCEMSRNSVLQSGFPHYVKKHWLGPNYTHEGVSGNDVSRTNVPDIRVAYRYEALIDELKAISRGNQALSPVQDRFNAVKV